MKYSKEHTGRKQKALTSKSKRNKNKAKVISFKVLLIGILALIVIAFAIGLGTLKSIIDNTPEINLDDVQPKGFLTTVYDQSGTQLTTLSDYDSNRIYVTINKIPDHLKNAFIAIEDERFYQHNGIDYKGILRAFFLGVKNGNFSEGASTITQQLLKNNVFAVFGEDSFMERAERKVQEQYLAVKIEKQLSKDKILEYYLNTINLGQSTLGVQAASHRYFNKDVNDLTLSECSVLAGITKNPSNLDPINHSESNNERRLTILKRMLDQKLISEDDYNKALKDDVYARIEKVNSEQSSASVYSYFMDSVILQLISDLQEKYGYNQTQAYNALYRGGLSIYLTQDQEIQAIADKVINNKSLYYNTPEVALGYRLSIRRTDGTDQNYSEYDVLKHLRKSNSKARLIFSNEKKAKAAVKAFKKTIYQAKNGDKILGEKLTTTIQPQVSFTLIDQSTGYVKALVGGRGEKSGNLTLNRATGSTRQPGSTFKVVSTFVPALDNAGLTLASTFYDAPYTWPGTNKSVRNHNYRYIGYASIRDAIRSSMNIVTAKTMEVVTPQVSYDYLIKMGFTTLVDKMVDKDGRVFSDIQYPTALGGLTNGVTNLELTASFAAIANKGAYNKPVLYTKVLDHDGNILIDNEADHSQQVMKESTAWLLTDAMKDVVTSGTGTKTRLNNMITAGKTGTTSNNYDHWFVGYSPYYTAGIWYGYDINTAFSSNSDKVIWKLIMDEVHRAKSLKNKDFPHSDGITSAQICSISGKLAVEGLCDHDPRGSMVRTEYFAKGSEPTEECDLHVRVTVCRISGLPASQYCPFYDLVSQVYIILPDDLADTEAEDNIYGIPADYQEYVCNLHSSLNLPDITKDPYRDPQDYEDEPVPAVPNE